MSYKKLLKLASYLKDRDRKTYIEIMKLAALSLDSFQSLILKCYPESGSPDNERLISKKAVLKRILDPKESNCTLEGLVEFIKTNDSIQKSDHSSVWQNPFEAGGSDYKSSEAIIRTINEKLGVGSSKSDVGADLGKLKDLFSRLENIKVYHDSVQQAVEDIKSVKWQVPRSDGSYTIGSIQVYDPINKFFRFAFQDGMIKDVSIKNIHNTDPGVTDNSRPLGALNWLRNGEVCGISITRSDGSIQECLLDKVSLDLLAEDVNCTFSFFQVGKTGIVSEMEKTYQIKLNEIDLFYSLGDNATILSMFKA